MDKIFRAIMSVYGGAVFIFWMIIAYFVFLFLVKWFKLLDDKSYLKFFYSFIGGAINKCLFLKVRKHIHYSYDVNESYVVVSNHQTMIDIPANVAGRPDEILFKFLGKKEAVKIPVFGSILKNIGVLVDRKNPKSRIKSFIMMKNEMKKGYSIFIYPEGTRNRTRDLISPFFNGAFKLAIDLQKPIVVNTLVNIKELNPPHSFFTYRPGTCDSHWDAPIPTKGLTNKDIKVLKEQVANIMLNRLTNKESK